MPKKTMRRGKKRGSKPSVSLHRPALPPMFRSSTVIRYVKTATGTATVVWRSLAALWVTATAGTTGICFMDAIKVNKVVCYCPPIIGTGTGGFLPTLFSMTVTTAQSDVNTSNSVFAMDRVYSAVPDERGAVISFTPPKDTNFGQWYHAQNLIGTANSSKFLDIQGPTGTVVDLHIGYQLGYTSAGTYSGVVGAGATAGRIYLNYLDSMTTTGTAGTQLLQCQTAGVGNTTLGWN